MLQKRKNNIQVIDSCSSEEGQDIDPQDAEPVDAQGIEISNGMLFSPKTEVHDSQKAPSHRIEDSCEEQLLDKKKDGEEPIALQRNMLCERDQFASSESSISSEKYSDES